MCNLSVHLPCLNWFDFLNWFFQPIRIKYLIKAWLEKQKEAKFCKKSAKIRQELQKFCKNTLETPDGADSNKLIQ